MFLMADRYWILERDEEAQLRFSKCFYDKADAEEYLPWFKDRVAQQIWQSPSTVTLEILPYGEHPPLQTRTASS